MEITKFRYTAEQLEGLGPDHLSALLLLGLFLNEVNWLQKLLLISTLDESGGEPEHRARLSLSLMLCKILATKMHEGWVRMTTDPLKQTLAALDLPADAVEHREKLAPLLAKDSVIHRVRALHGGHYL